MKTWEVVKALSENPKAKFTRVSDGRKFETNTTKVRDDETVDYYVSGIANGGSECIALNDEWELDRQPVPWQKAIQEYLNKKRIYVECDGETFKQSPHCRLGLFDGCEYKGVDEKLFRRGKWFIID